MSARLPYTVPTRPQYGDRVQVVEVHPDRLLIHAFDCIATTSGGDLEQWRHLTMLYDAAGRGGESIWRDSGHLRTHELREIMRERLALAKHDPDGYKFPWMPSLRDAIKLAQVRAERELRQLRSQMTDLNRYKARLRRKLTEGP